MKILKTSAQCLLVITVLFTGCAWNVRAHRNFQTLRSSIDSVAIVPPHVTFFERTTLDLKHKPEFEQGINGNVQSAIVNALTSGTRKIVALPISKRLLSDELGQSLDLMQATLSFALISDSIKKTFGKTIAFSLTPAARQLGDYAQADYLLFVSGMGFQTSGGGKTKDIVLGSLSKVFAGTQPKVQWHGLVLEIGLVDANSGKVLWYNRNDIKTSDYNPHDLKSIEKLCRSLLKPLTKSREQKN